MQTSTLHPIEAPERKAIADANGVDEQFLYQCLTGRKQMRADEAVRLEQATNRRVLRWQLRMHDWHLIWPELIDEAASFGVAPDPAVSGS
jgi:DNA-binding transcriptional regulator YdaS (Cro superfamily)